MIKKNKITIVIVFLAVVAVVAWLIWQGGAGRRFGVGIEKKNPNILLITACSLRQDHLGCYGYDRNTTPNIDMFARQAAVYKNCYTFIPWTKPAITALMTGKHPADVMNFRRESTLPEALKAQGYRTCAVSGTNVVREQTAFNETFEVFFDNLDMKTGQGKSTVPADVLVSRAIECLSGEPRRNDSPIFLWVFFKDPHWKYLPPPEYRALFVDDRFYRQHQQTLRINDNLHDSLGGIGEARLWDNDGGWITDKAYYIAQYDADIRFMDAQIGRLMEYMKAAQDFDDWMIVFCSDHGESLGENDYFFDHGYFLSEGLVKIPLLIKMPGQKKSLDRPEFVSIADIPKMILKTIRSKRWDSGFFKKYLRLRNKFRDKMRTPEEYIILENSPYHEKEQEIIIACVGQFYKLIWNVTRDEFIFYDISSGRDIIINRENQRQKRLREKMMRQLTAYYYARKSNDAQTIEELKSLGYLQ